MLELNIVDDKGDNGGDDDCFNYNDYNKRHVIVKKERSILEGLKSYPFHDDLKNKADEIYNKMIYQVRRGKVLDQLKFWCVYNAHRELGRDVDPIGLGKEFGLTTGEVQRCDSIFSPLQTGYYPPKTSISPLSYLTSYCQKLDLSEDAIVEIKLMTNSIMNKCPRLRQENPQTVAAGILRYYTIMNGISSEDNQKLSKITNRSIVTIDSMYKRISEIDNS